MSRPRAFLRLSGAAALALALGTCTGERGVVRETPLLDGEHQPDVLVERKRLERPPSLNGNRFLTGWRPYRRHQPVSLMPVAEASRVEVVTLKPRPRKLILGTRGRGAGSGAVSARAEGLDLGQVKLGRTMRIALPPELPVGRTAIELDFPDRARPRISSAELNKALPQGVVEFKKGGIEQSGWSAVDFVRLMEGPARLQGRFAPPRDPLARQRFSVIVEREDAGPLALFSWGGSEATGRAGVRPLDLEIPGGAGFIRLRLLAEETGEAAFWSDLKLVERAPAPPQPIAPPDPPRLVLFYLMDALRADFLGHLGGPEGVSPTLDDLAAEGVTFTSHYSVAPNTKPSVKALFTGRIPVFRGHTKLPRDGPPTLAEKFAAAGYRAAAFSGSPWVSGWMGTNRGFEYQSREAFYEPGGEHNTSAEQVQQAALAWLEKLEAGERAFVYLHTMNPHNPYDPPEPFRSRFIDGIDSEAEGRTNLLKEIRRGKYQPGPADQEMIKALYAAGVAYNDSQIRIFLEELFRHFDRREVLLVFTSDHGDEFFEHGSVLHGYTLYEDQIHVPLIISWPGGLRSRRVEVMTDHLDLHATLAQLAGAEELGDGRPLWSVLKKRRPVPDPQQVLFASASGLKGGTFLARWKSLKYVWAPRQGDRWGQGQGPGRTTDPEYVFDLETDPGENVNLAGSSGLAVEWLRSQLVAWVEKGRLQEEVGELPEMDEERLEQLRALGYVD